MSKKTTGADIGYRAYFAAFAVMLIIVIAAVCILSGCFDSMIFKADVPSGVDSGDVQTPSVNDDTNDLTEPPETDTGDTEEQLPPDTESDTEKDTESDTEEEDTTKAEDTTTKVEDTTTKAEDTTTEPITTPEETTTQSEIKESEIIKGQNNNLLYDYENDALTITGYDGSAATVSVPISLDGVEVKAIGRGAFAGRSDVEEVKLSAGITEIRANAFENCSSLVFVYIPTTVKEISSNAFDGSNNVIIYCAEGSYAEHFASDNGIECYAD